MSNAEDEVRGPLTIYRIGDRVRLSPLGQSTYDPHGADPRFVVLGVLTDGPPDRLSRFGSGVGIRVVPAVKPDSPKGAQDWYDVAHFVLAEDVTTTYRDGEPRQAYGGTSVSIADEVVDPHSGTSAEANRVKELESVLRSVREQFDVFGNRMPDGFDSRVFRWVDDALQGTSALNIAPDHESQILEVIAERDLYHHAADELANDIAALLGVEIGEHSSANDPWDNAIEAIAAVMRAAPSGGGAAVSPAPPEPSRTEVLLSALRRARDDLKATSDPSALIRAVRNRLTATLNEDGLKRLKGQAS